MKKATAGFDELSAMVINAIIKVHQTLGPGFKEGIYRRALVIELRKRSMVFETEKLIVIRYESEPVGRHRLDVVVESRIVLELKAVEALSRAHYAQLRSYLKATGIKQGLLVNFSTEKADFRRVESK
jgi:GxxExxY protein